MHVKDWLKLAQKKLEATGIGTARLDALVLLEDVTAKDRAWLLAHPEYEITAGKVRKLTNLLNRRAEHEPLAYVRKKTEFYGREFIITPAVLEPRPESETMIDQLKKLSKSPGLPAKPRIADVGTGSGALGITAKLELPNTNVDLLEIDQQALKVAKSNVDKFTLNISLIRSDLLAQSGQDYDILLCNLPYVPDDFQINPAAMREPRLAIFGGPDGLDIYRRLFKQIRNLRKQPLYILTEALPPQQAELAAIAKSVGYDLQQADDFIQLFAVPCEISR
jgi:release factor glutamine methyltransferase